MVYFVEMVSIHVVLFMLMLRYYVNGLSGYVHVVCICKQKCQSHPLGQFMLLIGLCLDYQEMGIKESSTMQLRPFELGLWPEGQLL